MYLATIAMRVVDEEVIEILDPVLDIACTTNGKNDAVCSRIECHEGACIGRNVAVHRDVRHAAVEVVAAASTGPVAYKGSRAVGCATVEQRLHRQFRAICSACQRSGCQQAKDGDATCSHRTSVELQRKRDKMTNSQEKRLPKKTNNCRRTACFYG